jgi:hypothetical protein
MWWRSGLLACAYFAVAAVTALALFAYGAYDCYESCADEPNAPWPDDPSAWQWDAVLWLGVGSGVAAVAFLWLVFLAGARFAAAALAANVAFAAAGGIFEDSADQVETSLVVVVVLALAVLGAALLRVRPSVVSSRAGARGTRAGPSV